MKGRRTAHPAPGGRLDVRLVLATCWILALAAYQPPQRSGALSPAGLDWIALVKVVSRAAAGGLLATSRRTGRRATLPSRRSSSG